MGRGQIATDTGKSVMVVVVTSEHSIRDNTLWNWIALCGTGWLPYKAEHTNEGESDVMRLSRGRWIEVRAGRRYSSWSWWRSVATETGKGELLLFICCQTLREHTCATHSLSLSLQLLSS